MRVLRTCQANMSYLAFCSLSLLFGVCNLDISYNKKERFFSMFEMKEGKTAVRNVDECALSPCKNGASCNTTDDGYSCQPCPAGWKGKIVMKVWYKTKLNEDTILCLRLFGDNFLCWCDIKECESSPCKNGGTCENQPGGYSCSCVNGYTGKVCEQDIDECANDPCLNGGKCHNEAGGYVCECPAGYEGSNCENRTDECKDNPCKNGGTCFNCPPGSYSCICAKGYKGKTCEEVDWTTEGCYIEKNKLKVFPNKFATVWGINANNPDIEKAYTKCKAKAEMKGYKIFAIRNARRCVTSKDGKAVDFKSMVRQQTARLMTRVMVLGLNEAARTLFTPGKLNGSF
ncbi:hypothetical protein OS493_006844 [Desmophyllum pertusum]|uniref:EGF-like domain-containing protein n=1 Tax=Desmophyllum pertusum TaxID=174260 RepID=A0A9W9ZVM9_9CNID|nr:hypothetical protein OS493_006844 [Desmophyllum pertusum]